MLRAAVLRNHHVHLGGDGLLAELEPVDRLRARALALDLFPRTEIERPRGADARAHRLQAHRRAVVAHVALHHQRELGLHLRHAERTGQHAVVARDAARFSRGLRSEEHTSELQSRLQLVCRLLLAKKKSGLPSIDAMYGVLRW